MNLLPRPPVGGMLLLAACFHAHAAPVALPAYNVDPARISVSGLSSGGFMAVQLHVAYSATFRAGAGIVAGGPFYCAQGNLGTALGPCMNASPYSKPATAALVAATNSWANQGLIDPTSNLAASRVYLFSGSADTTVKPLVMDEARAYYGNFIGAGNIEYNRSVPAEHAMVTDNFGNSCGTKASPYINDCNVDLAGAMLEWLHGGLRPRNNGTLGGQLLEFRQTEFISDAATHGVAASGWAFVPASCTAGARCGVHVVMHGCQQDPTKIQDRYYRNTGYNRWADTNDLIVLYPQSAPQSVGNPNGCWDWWGYDDPNYALKSGRQMVAVKAMVDRVSGGQAGGGGEALQPPSGLAVTARGADSVTLGWRAAAGATGYHVYRDGNRVTGGPVAATSYTDSGLAAGGSYRYTVSSVADGKESAASAPLTAGPGSSPDTGFQCSSTTASNYGHVREGRAAMSQGYTYAKGSNQPMGLFTIFHRNTLAQTAQGYYVVGQCP